MRQLENRQSGRGDPQSAGTASDRPGNQSGGDRHPRENRPQDGRANPIPARIEDLGNLRQSSESGVARHGSGTALLRSDAGRVSPFSRPRNHDVFANHGSACDQICRTSAAYANLRLHAQPEDRPSTEDLRHAAGVSGGWQSVLTESADAQRTRGTGYSSPAYCVIKVIFYIGMYTGQRLKDCVLLQWQNVDLVHRRIQVKQFKTGKEVSIPIAPPLLQVLEEAKERRIDAYVSPNVAQRYKQTNQQGKCIGDGLVNIDVMRVIRWIGVEIDSFYTHVGEEAQRAAIDAISGIKSTNHAETRIHNALAYIEQLQDKTSEILTIKRILQE